MSTRILAHIALPALMLACCAPEPAPQQPTPQEPPPMTSRPSPPSPAKAITETATFAAGCFWCVEAVFEQLDGVLEVSSGYMGGSVANPTYKQVCTGTTGHAEVVQMKFDPTRITFGKLADWFFQLHDPTTLDRQGPDEGTQYRSAMFFHTDAQRQEAEAARQRAQKNWPAPIVTEISAAGPFYEAEEYHQDYYRLNKQAGYCRVMIAPKLEKLGLEK